MIRELLKYPHPLLAKKSEHVQEITPEIEALAQDMADTMYEKRGVGLAAPQVGQCLRLIAIDASGPDERNELMFLVNPEITAQEGAVEDEEGCLSVVNYRTKVKRASKVTVKATDLSGNPVEIEAEGIKAVCLQHEIDHLDGLLFIDRISRLKRALYDGKIKKWQQRKQKNP